MEAKVGTAARMAARAVMAAMEARRVATAVTEGKAAREQMVAMVATLRPPVARAASPARVAREGKTVSPVKMAPQHPAPQRPALRFPENRERATCSISLLPVDLRPLSPGWASRDIPTSGPAT
jgi:hypothetical protein